MTFLDFTAIFKIKEEVNITTSINAKIKELRKSSGLNQKEFASKIGLTQRGVSHIEQDGHNISDVSIKAICHEFGINEAWLREGTGPMRVQKDTFSLDQFAKDRDMSQTELQILKIYFEMDPKIRHEALDYFLKRIAELHLTDTSSIPATPEELEKNYPPVDMHTQTG